MSQSLLSTFTPLAIPVPPMLEGAPGYAGQSRWVAFHWEPGDDELRYHDGAVSADGSWHAWLTFAHHRRVAPALAPYYVGNAEEDAVHWLLRDRETRTLFVGACAAVSEFLRQSAFSLLTSEALIVLRKTRRERLQEPQDVQAAVAHAMQRAQQLVTALTAWLDAN